NSYRIAKWTQEYFSKSNFNTFISSITDKNSINNIKNDKSFSIGFFFPTHGFIAPFSVIKFAISLPRKRNAKAIIVATRAGWMIGKRHLPGVEGTGPLIISLILFLKGYDIRGFFAVDMPSNWLQVHWGLKPENTNWFTEKAKIKTIKNLEEIIGGKRIYRGWISIFLGIILFPLSLAYLFIGRFTLSKIMFADFNCNSCGICWNNCPLNAIEPKGKDPKPFWTFKCENCQRCIAFCPKKSIQTGFLYVILIHHFTTISFTVVIMLLPGHLNIPQFLFKVLNIGYYLLFVYLGYFVLFYLSKINILNRMFAYTTPTKIFRRYHEPVTTLTELSSR
ncbi:MAG: EFR1 family ferrodoxin, partial [Elusimicrobiota bacterium]